MNVDVTVADVLRSAAARRPDAIAMVDGSAPPTERRTWTYQALLDECEGCAAWLCARFQPGERVAIWAPNSPEWLIVEYAAAVANLTIVTVNPASQASELRHVLAHSGAAGILLVDAFRGNPMLEILRAVMPELPALREVALLDQVPWRTGKAPSISFPLGSPDDVAQIQYTSGTTGVPKAVELRHRGVTANAYLAAERLGPPDVVSWIDPVPMFHTGGGLSIPLGVMWNCGTIIPVTRFDPVAILRLVEDEGATVLTAVPAMLTQILAELDHSDYDLTSLHIVVTGGSSVSSSLLETVEQKLGVVAIVGYGQTEAGPTVAQTAPWDSPHDRYSTVGLPLAGVELRLRDPDTGGQPATGAGELCVRSPYVMKGYLDDTERTAEALGSDGWLRTGDLATIDERGYVRIVGRLRDMIIRGGENIYPRELEAVLASHPGVADVAVVGLPDERWGETVAAFIVRAHQAPATEAELFQHVRAAIAPHKTPTTWVYVDELPRNHLGKVNKASLRDDWLAGRHR